MRFAFNAMYCVKLYASTSDRVNKHVFIAAIFLDLL